MQSFSLARRPVVESVLSKLSLKCPVFKVRTVHPLSPELLPVCRQVLAEGRRILNLTARSLSSVSKKLHAQIGPLNFGHVKHLVIGWSDLRRLSHSFRNQKSVKVYQILTIQEDFLVDLDRS